MRHGLGALERDGDLYRGTEADSLGVQVSLNATSRTVRGRYSTETDPASKDASSMTCQQHRANFSVLTVHQLYLMYLYDP
jgi:hypothetical protein